MKRYLAVALALGLLAGTLGVPAEAAKKKKKPAVRVFEVRYENPAFGVGGAGGSCSGCPGIVVGAKETFAIIQITDDNSPTGYVSLNYDSDGDGIQNLGSGPIVCGETPEPVPIEAGASYTAWPWAAGIECPGASSTAGTIKVFLSSDEAALTKAAAKS
ncbi:MAG TPA: hypothetical protein VJ927_08395 [Actinomycetota bacterium]|nr:hypothetical protein [Actinomycetota bacterium]